MTILQSPYRYKISEQGRQPPVKLTIQPLNNNRSLQWDQFISYQFDSNIVVPVDSFTFSFISPDDANSAITYFQEGDIAQVTANGKALCTGIIDQVEIETEVDSERVSVSGRDMIAQLEDNAAVTFDKLPIYGDYAPKDVLQHLIDGTRIKNTTIRNAPDIKTLFMTTPGESRLSALLRYLEPLNCLVWADNEGRVVLGRPNFAQPISGSIICSRTERKSNCISIRATYSATSIPNRIVVLYNNVQETQIGLQANQIVDNAAERPSRLRKAGHNVIKTTMTSIPKGADSSSFAAAAEYQVAGGGAATLINLLAQREFARANFNELQVQAVVPGHYNDFGNPYRPDQTYKVTYDRGKIDEIMYLYAVQYNLSPDRGQYSVLSFCRKNTIVAGSPAL